MTRAVIITGPGFQDHDVIYTYYRSLEAGFEIEVATAGGQPVTGKYGVSVPLDKRAKPPSSFEDLDVDAFDLVHPHRRPRGTRSRPPGPRVLAFVRRWTSAARSSRASATGRGSWSRPASCAAAGRAPTSACATTW